MTNGAQSYDGVIYKRNYVDQVIARVDFISPLSGIESSLPHKLSQAILTNFPIGEPRHAIAQELQIAPNQEVTAKKTSCTEWHFHGRNRDKTFVLLPGAVFLTRSKYETFELVRDEFVSLLNVFFEVFKEAQPSRMGLRYINKIQFPDGNPLEWAEYINPHMLALFEFPKDKATLSRIFHNLEFAFDDFSLRYQFGMHNPDFPAQIRKKLFTLDLDAYHQGPIEPAEIAISLNKYHECIQDFFEMSITNALRGKMNE
jgi:uncharacterized protein (TIGR04255 family)